MDCDNLTMLFWPPWANSYLINWELHWMLPVGATCKLSLYTRAKWASCVHEIHRYVQMHIYFWPSHATRGNKRTRRRRSGARAKFIFNSPLAQKYIQKRWRAKGVRGLISFAHAIVEWREQEGYFQAHSAERHKKKVFYGLGSSPTSHFERRAHTVDLWILKRAIAPKERDFSASREIYIARSYHPRNNFLLHFCACMKMFCVLAYCESVSVFGLFLQEQKSAFYII